MVHTPPLGKPRVARSTKRKWPVVSQPRPYSFVRDKTTTFRPAAEPAQSWCLAPTPTPPPNTEREITLDQLLTTNGRGDLRRDGGPLELSLSSQTVEAEKSSFPPEVIFHNTRPEFRLYYGLTSSNMSFGQTPERFSLEGKIFGQMQQLTVRVFFPRHSDNNTCHLYVFDETGAELFVQRDLTMSGQRHEILIGSETIEFNHWAGS